MFKYLFEHQDIFWQLLGGILTFTSGLLAIFYKDTIDKTTRRLTQWGKGYLILFLLGAGITIVAKYIGIKEDIVKAQLELLAKDSVIDAQNKQHKQQLDSFAAITARMAKLASDQEQHFERTEHSLDSSLKDLNVTSSALNPLSPLLLKFSLSFHLKIPELQSLYIRMRNLNTKDTAAFNQQVNNFLDSGLNAYASNYFQDYEERQMNIIFFNPFNPNEIISFPEAKIKTKRYLLKYNWDSSDYWMRAEYEVGAEEPYSLTGERLLNAARIHQFDIDIVKFFPAGWDSVNYPKIGSRISLKFPNKDWVDIDLSDDAQNDFKYDGHSQWLDRFQTLRHAYDKYVKKGEKPDCYKVYRIHYWDYRGSKYSR